MLTTCWRFSYSGLAFHSISRSSLCCRLSASARSSGLAHMLVPASDGSKSAASSRTTVRRAFCAWNPSSLSRCCSAAIASATLGSSAPAPASHAPLPPLLPPPTPPPRRRCASRSAAIRSRPRSARSSLIMSRTSPALSSGRPQNVHGPGPSLTHTTLPQLRQLGAASSSGCRVATQLHRRAATPAAVLDSCVGFVVISSDRIAWSRSASTVDDPCIGTPPVMDTFAAPPWLRDGAPGVDADFDLPFDLGSPSSDTSVPAEADDGGGFGCCAACAGALPRLLLPLDDADAPGFPDMYSSSCWSLLLYTVPGASANDATGRGGGVWMAVLFFFLWSLFRGRCFWTASISEPWAELAAGGGGGDGDGAGSARRALKVDMNSTTWGESPSRFVKCSAASALESVDA